MKKKNPLGDTVFKMKKLKTKFCGELKVCPHSADNETYCRAGQVCATYPLMYPRVEELKVTQVTFFAEDHVESASFEQFICPRLHYPVVNPTSVAD